MRIRGGWIFALVLAACGGDDGPAEPQPLEADPAVATGCLGDPVSAGSSRAKVIECAAELPQGLLASGRIGDIVLENSRIELVIRAFGEGLVFPGTTAGSLVDAAQVGGEDLLREIQTIVELNVAQYDEFVIVEAGDDGPAEVVVRGQAAPIPLLKAAVDTTPVPAIVETHYVLLPDADEVLIQTFLFPLDKNAESVTVQVGEIFFYSGYVTSFIPGLGQPDGLASGELIASAGRNSSYAIVYPPELAPRVQFLDIQNVTGLLGPLRTLSNPAPIERWFVVGDGSISSVTAEAFRLRGTELGTISGSTAANVDIIVTDSSDQPATIGRSDASGQYALSVPPGSYSLHTGGIGRLDGAVMNATVTAGGQATADLDGGVTASVTITVEDDSATAMPARVVITGDGEERIEYVGASGSLTLAIAPGTYTLVVSRGVEYDAFTVDPLVIAANDAQTIPVTLNHVIDTDGWISLDTHLHSENSLDSSVPLELRLAAVAAEGVDVAISTDHDYITDYTRALDATGLGQVLAIKAGVETSSLQFGHLNAWPLVADENRAANGAFLWYGLPPGDVFAMMRDVGSQVVVQVNHPRNSGSGLFLFIDFNRETGLADQDPALLGFPGADFNDFNFDAVEVANDFNSTQFAESFDDWLALVDSGHPAAATGSSDSHGAGKFAGKSRTYVYVGSGNDSPATADLAAVDVALKQRKVTVSQGAFVTAEIVDPGTTLPSAPGSLTDVSGEAMISIHIKVQAPPWMPLDSIEIYHGRTIATTIVLDSGDTAAVRYDNIISLMPDSKDSFFVVLVRPAGRGDPVLGQPDASFTNPLLYDRDGDGNWTP